MEGFKKKEKGPPALGRIRIADPRDIPEIMELMTEAMSKTFKIYSEVQIQCLLEDGVLSVVQLNSDKKIVTFLSLRDYPITPYIGSQDWEDLIWTKYKQLEMNARNSLFVHMLAWHHSYGREAIDRMLRAIFMHDQYVHYIAMLKWDSEYPLLIPNQLRSEGSFRRVQANERGARADALPLLCLAERKDVSPRMRIRRAVEEDNDDIIPILKRHSVRLTEMYGEFYISELIARHPEMERILLVAEHKELAFAIMCLNTQINLESLEENYELSPFSGLRKIKAKPKMSVAQEDSMLNLAAESRVTDEHYFKDVLNLTRDKHASKVTIADFDESETSLLDDGNNVVMYTDYLQMLEDDEDEFEYDIVNIDTHLIRYPQIMSYENLEKGAFENLYGITSSNRGDESPKPNDLKLKKKMTSAANLYTHHKSVSVVVTEPVHYTGDSNAFIIELFAVEPSYDERYGFDILEVAFEMFPDRDYCIICLPSNQCPFPLLEHFTLVTPYAVKKTFINESLYVAHKNSILGDLRVRYGEAADVPNIDVLLENTSRHVALVDVFRNSLTSYTLESFVMLSENQPVGVVVVGPLNNAPTVRSQYELSPEPIRDGVDGAILLGVLSPAFEPHARWFMRNIIRHSKYTMMFWMCQVVGRGEMSSNRNLMSFTGRMVPVRPRRTLPNLTGSRDLDFMFKDDSIPFALWFIERPLTSLPKVDVNNSIVIVGASTTGLSFLETLLSGPTAPYLTFTNITIVSEYGIPTVTDCLRAANTCIPRAGRFNDRYLKSIGLHYYVDVVTGLMTKIDRKKRCIHLKSGGIKNYDTLVLTFGQQFQHPDYLKESLQKAKEREEVDKPCVRMLMHDPRYQPDRVPPPPEFPENVMIINSITEANRQLIKLMNLITETKNDQSAHLCNENRVVVYGDCIEAYSCIAALLELGLSPEMISLVEPFGMPDIGGLRVNCFNDEHVDEHVQRSVHKLGVHVYRRTSLAGWRMSGGRVRRLRLLSWRHAFQIPVFALFYYGKKAIEVHAFKAVNECGLVYDGGLVVGPDFDTNDPTIFAAGTCTKYSRALYADKWTHKYFASENIGEELAQIFIKKLDPFKINNPYISSAKDIDLLAQTYEHLQGSRSLTRVPKTMRKWEPVSRYQSPVYIFAKLPGPLYYMKVRKPGIEIPMEVQAVLPNQGHILKTHVNGYFRLHLNVLHCIESITALSEKQFYPELFVQAYGKHEAYFNRLLQRYVLNQINDFFSYFTQPWMATVYQETYDLLMWDVENHKFGTIYDVAELSASSSESLETRSSAREAARRSLSQSASCYDPHDRRDPHDPRPPVPSRANMPEDAEELGCFRNIIDNYVIPHEEDLQKLTLPPQDIPSECGQKQALRDEVRAFWDLLKGDKMAMRHLGKYLHQYQIINPHYALPLQELL